MPAAYSITCPSCGSAFLATQTRPTSITTCPHCAYNAPLQAFQAGGVTTIGPATALPLRRRDPRTHYQQLPLPTTPPHPLTPPTSAPPHPLTPPTATPPSPPPASPPFTPPPLTPASAPPTPIFPELPVFTTSPFSNPPPAPPTPPQPNKSLCPRAEREGGCRIAQSDFRSAPEQSGSTLRAERSELSLSCSRVA